MSLNCYSLILVYLILHLALEEDILENPHQNNADNRLLSYPRHRLTSSTASISQNKLYLYEKEYNEKVIEILLF